MVAVTITASNKVTRDGREFGVPKRDLIGVLEVTIRAMRSKSLASSEAKALVNELLNFEQKMRLAGRDTYETWREDTHENLVL